MNPYEYLVISEMKNNNLTARLNELAREGWEPQTLQVQAETEWTLMVVMLRRIRVDLAPDAHTNLPSGLEVPQD